MRALLRALSVGLGLLVALAAVLSIGAYLLCLAPVGPPTALRAARARGPLFAGAGRVEMKPPWPVSHSGYRAIRPSARSALLPPEASAVVLEIAPVRVALVTLDLMIAPVTLVDAVRARARALGLEQVWVAATHSHSSMGGYDPRWLSEAVGVGLFRRDVTRAVVDAAEAALRAALASRAPATVRISEGSAPDLTRARDGIAPSEHRLTRVELDMGESRAQLLVLGGHPTLVPVDAEPLDTDYPGRLVQLERGSHAVTLVLQGGSGNASSRPPPGEGALADRQASAWHSLLGTLTPRSLEEPSLAFAQVRVPLTCPDATRLVPRGLGFPSRALLCAWTPREAELGVLELGPLRLLFVPGEPTFAAARALEEAADAQRVVSLTGGYIGYVELPERVLRREGEADHHYYSPELLEQLQRGAELAARNTTAAAP